MGWIGLLVGILVGGALSGWGGALSLGILGAIVGLIIKSQQAGKAPAPKAAARPPDAALIARVSALEARLARVESLTVGASDFVVTRGGEVAATPATPEATPPAAVEPRPSAPETVVPETPRTPAAKAPARPAKPNFIIEWFTGGNTIVRVGLVVLFVGLAFLIKYSVEHQLVPVELRVAAVAAVGLALLILGWKLRARRAGYALSLQGAGVAVLYLTIFGALRLYGLIPAGMAFVMLAAIAALSAFLAIAQDSLALAVFGAAGGFLAPVLASTGHGSHVMLFSYFLVLNAGIVAIAWFKSWRVLNLVGFGFTFLIGLAWGLRSYRAEYFESVEAFLAAFFLMYVAIGILFTRRQAPAHRSYVDGTIVFGTPIAAFGLQAALMRGSEFGLAYSSVAAGAFYLVLAAVLARASRERWALLAESFLAMGVVFASLAIPLALDARWTSAAWALEGAAIFWAGVRQSRPLARAFGMLLQVGAAGAFVRAYPSLPGGAPLVDAAFVGMVLISLAGLVTHRLIMGSAKPTSLERGLAPFAFLWGLGWWVAAGANEIHTFVDRDHRLFAAILFVTATTAGFAMLARRPHWEHARWPEWVFAPLLFLFAVASFGTHAHPFEDLGWIAWPIALIAHFAMLRADERGMPRQWMPWPHAIGAVVIAMLGAMEIEWLATEYTAPGTAWALSARIVAPALVLLAISSRAADIRWPVATNLRAYRWGAALPLLAAMLVWSLHINFSHGGGSEPLPYLPIVNAIDLGHILAIFAIAAWWLALARSGIDPGRELKGTGTKAVAAAVAFIWLNAILLRTMHHWTGVAYQSHALLASVAVQAALSIFWATLALTLMLFATRTARRALWLVGAALMGVVVVKLVLVDLSRLGGLERIVSFIGVGVLMLVIGYSPVPPRATQEAS
ncbi:MAG: DUF2339 domain-containing protein [Usitatibacter sp.]